MTETHDGPSEGTTINGEPPRQRRFVRENWYRDVWLFAITLLVVGALIAFQDNQNDLEKVVNDNSVLNTKLCKVVIDVHDANVARMQAQRTRLIETRNYLRNLAPDEVGSTLVKRVRANVPNVIAELHAAQKTEVATRPPKQCREVRRKE